MSYTHYELFVLDGSIQHSGGFDLERNGRQVIEQHQDSQANGNKYVTFEYNGAESARNASSSDRDTDLFRLSAQEDEEDAHPVDGAGLDAWNCSCRLINLGCNEDCHIDLFVFDCINFTVIAITRTIPDTVLQEIGVPSFLPGPFPDDPSAQSTV
ncbi:ENHANCED DISEASE RESISTANCE 2-like protein [Drosera capensis]